MRVKDRGGNILVEEQRWTEYFDELMKAQDLVQASDVPEDIGDASHNSILLPIPTRITSLSSFA